MSASGKYIVVFVEGDTDKVFFEALLRYYAQKSKSKLNDWEICSIRGVERYESKVISKLKNGLIPKLAKSNKLVHAVCCSYDTDVFEYAERPVVNWRKIRKSVKELGVPNFLEIEVKQMIEDWFLCDLSGLCKYLKISVPSKLEGKDGFSKMKLLFKKGNKIYQKGLSCQRFINSLDISVIRNTQQTNLAELEKLLGVKW